MTAMTQDLRILPYTPDRAAFFEAVNREWIESMFVLEDLDAKVLADPQTHIMDSGGDILFVEVEGKGLVGAGALKKLGPGVYELTKMGVTADARGHKAGEALLKALIDRAQEMKAEKLFLLTNSICEAAIHLYEKNGFEHSDEIKETYGKMYCRCDVAMEWQG